MIHPGNTSIKRPPSPIHLSEYRKGEQGVLYILKSVGGMFGHSLGATLGQVIRRIFLVTSNIPLSSMSRKGFCYLPKTLYHPGKKKKCEHKPLQLLIKCFVV